MLRMGDVGDIGAERIISRLRYTEVHGPTCWYILLNILKSIRDIVGPRTSVRIYRGWIQGDVGYRIISDITLK